MKRESMRAIVCVGVLYLIVGLISASLAKGAASHQGVVTARLAAWIISAIAFGAQIVYEQVRLQHSTGTTARHVALAAGLGAFGLAAAANVNALMDPARQPSLILMLSLAIWPIMTALPAFIVALVSAMILAKVRQA